MRDADNDFIAALQQRVLVERKFVYIIAKDFDTGDPEAVGFWTGNGVRSVSLIDAKTRQTVSRDFVGSSPIVSISAIPMTSDITIRSVTIDLSLVHQTANNFVRGFNLKGAEIQVHRGLFNRDTLALASPAHPQFLGLIDSMSIKTDALGGGTVASLQCVSETRELTRINPDKRSSESQKRRTAGDTFYDHAPHIHKRQLFWGLAKSPPPQ